MSAEEIDEEDESIGDEFVRRLEVCKSRREQLELAKEFFPGSPEVALYRMMPRAYISDVVDLSETGGIDPREVDYEFDRRLEACKSPREQLELAEEFFPGDPEVVHYIMTIGAYIGDFVDLSETGGKDPREG